VHGKVHDVHEVGEVRTNPTVQPKQYELLRQAAHLEITEQAKQDPVVVVDK